MENDKKQHNNNNRDVLFTPVSRHSVAATPNHLHKKLTSIASTPATGLRFQQSRLSLRSTTAAAVVDFALDRPSRAQTRQSALLLDASSPLPQLKRVTQSAPTSLFTNNNLLFKPLLMPNFVNTFTTKLPKDLQKQHQQQEKTSFSLEDEEANNHENEEDEQALNDQLFATPEEREKRETIYQAFKTLHERFHSIPMNELAQGQESTTLKAMKQTHYEDLFQICCHLVMENDKIRSKVRELNTDLKQFQDQVKQTESLHQQAVHSNNNNTTMSHNSMVCKKISNNFSENVNTFACQ